MCLHGSLSVLSPSQLLPGIVGPEPQGEWGGFAGDAQGGAIHARCVEACVCVRTHTHTRMCVKETDTGEGAV